MPRFRLLLMCVLAAMWLPTTLHCAMERAKLFDSAPGCCGRENGAMTAEERTCEELCPTFEPISNKSSEETSALGAPVLFAVVDALALATTAAVAPAPSDLSEATSSPPELARTWHFTARAAPPPRAPSLA